MFSSRKVYVGLANISERFTQKKAFLSWNKNAHSQMY